MKYWKIGVGFCWILGFWMAFRCWKVLARSAGEVVRGGKGGRVVASLGSRSVSALEEGRHTLSSSSKFRFQGLIDGIRYTARAASNDALDIVRYLDGAEDEESDEFTEEAPVVENAEEFERFSDSDGDSDGNSGRRNGSTGDGASRLPTSYAPGRTPSAPCALSTSLFLGKRKK
jgi:hypothetical protein